MQNRDENDENGLSGNSSNTWRALGQRVEGTSKLASKLVQREGVEQEEQQSRRRWTRMTAARGRRLAGGAGAEQGGASVAWARARGGEWARSLWRGGEAV